MEFAFVYIYWGQKWNYLVGIQRQAVSIDLLSF